MVEGSTAHFTGAASDHTVIEGIIRYGKKRLAVNG